MRRIQYLAKTCGSRQGHRSLFLVVIPAGNWCWTILSFHRLDMTLAIAEALNPNKPNQPKPILQFLQISRVLEILIN